MTKTKKHRKPKPDRKKPAKSELTWREAVRTVFASARSGELALSELYDALAKTAKSRKNPTWKATIRRTLQQDDTLEPAGARGTWKLKGGR